MSKSKKRNIIIGSLCAIVLLMAVGYAAFQTVLNIEGTSNITSSWDIKITNVTSKNIKGTASNNGDPSFENLSATFKTNLQAPGDSIEYDITVTNNGNLNAKLDKYKLTDTNNEAIKFTQTGLTNGEVLTAGSTKTFTVKVEYLSIVSEQPSKVTSSLTITLDYSQAENGYTPGEQVASEQLTSNLVTSGDGLYEDTYEPGRYVYKGANPNNYITFNNEEWRIISVEADGTLKIMKNSSIGSMAYDSAGLRGVDTGLAEDAYCNLNRYGCNAWMISDSFINEGGEGPVLKNAELNDYLNNEYYDSFTNTAKAQIINHNFAVGGAASTNNDLMNQIKDENRMIWNGKIGLISASDYLKGNRNISKCETHYLNQENVEICKQSNYLINNYSYWVITPHITATYRGFRVSSTGSLGWGINANAKWDILPSLYLKSDIMLTGNGTKDNPYTIN